MGKWTNFSEFGGRLRIFEVKNATSEIIIPHNCEVVSSLEWGGTLCNRQAFIAQSHYVFIVKDSSI